MGIHTHSNALNGQTTSIAHANVAGATAGADLRNFSDQVMLFRQQQNQLMQMLVQSNIRASLPPPQVKAFISGNPLEYRSFVKAFEHAIESKTINDTDRLYYLDQYTRGSEKQTP